MMKQINTAFITAAGFTMLASNDSITLPTFEQTNPPSEDLLTEDQYYIVLKCTLVFRFFISVGGILGNTINIRTFLRMGLEDSVTIAFFNLAVSDLFILSAEFATIVSKFCQIIERDLDTFFELRPFFLVVLLNALGRIFSDVTLLVTTFLALQRCLCVVIPLHFKGVFTRLRTSIVIVVIWVYSVICGLLMLSQYEFVKRDNSSRFTMLVRPTQPYVLVYINVVNGLIVNITCQCIVFISLSFMRHVLGKSVKFRRQTVSAVTTGSGNAIQNDSSTKCEDKKGATSSSSVNIANSQRGTSDKNIISDAKERQAILQVSIVSTIFLITNTPYMITAIAALRNPDFSLYRKLHYTFVSIINIRVTIEMINSAVNFFVYYKYNSKFKKLAFARKNKYLKR